MRLFAHVPMFGRLARVVSAQPEPLRARSFSKRLRQGLSPARLVRLLRPPPPPEPPAPRLPLIGPVIRRVRQPLAQTARVVRAAREVRRPQTRWERLREAALQVIEDPVAATRWERLMGLGMGLAQGQRSFEPARRGTASALARILRGRAVEPTPKKGLRAHLKSWRATATQKENADPGKLRGRRGILKLRRGAR